MLCVAAAAAGFTATSAFSSRGGALRSGAPAMSLLKAEATAASVENFLSQAEAAQGIVCVAVTEPTHFLASNLLASAATSYASSMLYGGPSCSIIECSRAGPDAEVDALLAERLNLSGGIELPLCAVYAKASLAKVVAPAKLEETLLALGARSATKKDNLASRDFGAAPGGGPSATAVDEIDFTGGAGNAGRPNFVPKFNDAGRTTRGYFPGSFEENAGDYITREDGDGPVDRSRIVGDGKGPQGGPPGRRDKPPGVP